RALVRLAKAKSNHGRRKAKAEARHAARELLATVDGRYPVERKEPRRVGRLPHHVKVQRLRRAGWAPERDLPDHSMAELLGRAAAVGVAPVYVDGDAWFPRWLDASATLSELRRMKKDVRFRKAKLAELYCKGAP